MIKQQQKKKSERPIERKKHHGENICMIRKSWGFEKDDQREKFWERSNGIIINEWLEIDHESLWSTSLSW